MKKIVIFLFLCLILSFSIFACTKNIDGAVRGNLSEIRYNAFAVKNENFKANFMSGERENPYEYDGKSRDKCDFGVITVVFNDFCTFMKVPFSLYINDEKVDGLLEKNPYNESFMADTGRRVNDNDVIRIKIGDGDEINLENISNNFKINFENALKIGINELNNELNSCYIKGKFNAECYLKIITSDNYNSDDFFWSFSVISSKLNNYSVIIDINSGKILVKKV